MKYTVVVNKTEYGYDAHCPALPGCHSQGDTFDEAIDIALSTKPKKKTKEEKDGGSTESVED